MFGFTLAWIGQFGSIPASAMSQFGMTILVLQKTEGAPRFDAGFRYDFILDHLSDSRCDGGSPQPQNGDDGYRPYTCMANLNISIPK